MSLNLRDCRSRTGRNPVLHPPAGGRRRYAFLMLGRAGTPFTIKTLYGHDSMAGATARDMRESRSRTAGEAAQELTWYDRVETPHGQVMRI